MLLLLEGMRKKNSLKKISIFEIPNESGFDINGSLLFWHADFRILACMPALCESNQRRTLESEAESVKERRKLSACERGRERVFERGSE